MNPAARTHLQAMLAALVAVLAGAAAASAPSAARLHAAAAELEHALAEISASAGPAQRATAVRLTQLARTQDGLRIPAAFAAQFEAARRLVVLAAWQWMRSLDEGAQP